MLWKVWATVGAIVCGILAATFAGGGLPPHAKLILLAALLVGVATTVVAEVVSNGRGWRVEQIVRRQVSPVPRRDREIENDREFIHRLYGLVREQPIDWLRFESFAGPWRDDHVASLRALVHFDANHPGVFEPELADAVGRLTDAARAFLRIYDSSTIADPIMRDASWRMIGRNGTAGELDGSTERDRIVSQTRLREAAGEICQSHDALSVVSRHMFPPDPSVRPPGRRR